MPRGILQIAVLGLLAAAAPALAQPAQLPVESVTVNGERAQDEQIKRFVESRAAPTFRLGKVARWEEGICPTAMGLKPEFLKFIIQRVKDIAAKAGAPVNPLASCKSNVEIVFTTAPQGMLDVIRREHPAYLGYYDNGDQADRLASVSQAIQAWYMTATIDLRGRVTVDSRKMEGACIDFDCPNNPDVSGTRLYTGLRSGLHHVIVAADPTKLVDYEIGTLADYIAMLVLTQPRALDDCETLPSILNLLTPNCAAGVLALSDGDLGYLRGAYHMTPDGTLRDQKDAIAFQMKQVLGGKK
jgi:hypothetical protein